MWGAQPPTARREKTGEARPKGSEAPGVGGDAAHVSVGRRSPPNLGGAAAHSGTGEARPQGAAKTPLLLGVKPPM